MWGHADYFNSGIEKSDRILRRELQKYVNTNYPVTKEKEAEEAVADSGTV